MTLESNIVEDAANLRERLEATSEKALFGARWLLAPFYFGLTGTIALLAAKFVQEFYTFAKTIFASDTHTVQLGILGLLEFDLVG